MTQANTGARPSERLLPDGAELARQRETSTLAAIGARYGVSRQAVFKAIQKWRRAQTVT